MKPLLPVAEALSQVLAQAQPLVDVEDVPLIDALGRVLAADQVSPLAVPGEDNSAMDGYAVRVADLGSGALPVSQRIPAGVMGEPLKPGTVARIFTGAPVPVGADAVVMQEDCRASDDGVVIDAEASPGQHIRPAGQDIQQGSTVLAAGRRLRPQDLGLLASIGCATVPVVRRLQVAILSTGDELVEPGGGVLAPGQLYNSNRYTLAGLLRSLDIAVIDGGIVPDDPDATRDALQQAADNADCVITSGGVSVGEEDHVKQQVEALGHLNLWKLAMKPGKPLAFGHIGETPFIGLPGNPSSVFVTFCLIARPYLLRLQGVTDQALPELKVRAGFSTNRPGGRQEYLRVMLEEDPAQGLIARRYANQSSGVLSSVSQSNALAVVPPGVTVTAGVEVAVLLLDLLAG